MSSRQRPIIDVYKELVCCKDNDIRGVTILLGIMMTIRSNTAVCECGFCCMNLEKSLLQTRLGEDTLDHMCINIDGLSFNNFHTEKFVSDWIESTVISRH